MKNNYVLVSLLGLFGLTSCNNVGSNQIMTNHDSQNYSSYKLSELSQKLNNYEIVSSESLGVFYLNESTVLWATLDNHLKQLKFSQKLKNKSDNLNFIENSIDAFQYLTKDSFVSIQASQSGIYLQTITNELYYYSFQGQNLTLLATEVSDIMSYKNKIYAIKLNQSSFSLLDLDGNNSYKTITEFNYDQFNRSQIKYAYFAQDESAIQVSILGSIENINEDGEKDEFDYINEYSCTTVVCKPDTQIIIAQSHYKLTTSLTRNDRELMKKYAKQRGVGVISISNKYPVSQKNELDVKALIKNISIPVGLGLVGGFSASFLAKKSTWLKTNKDIAAKDLKNYNLNELAIKVKDQLDLTSINSNEELTALKQNYKKITTKEFSREIWNDDLLDIWRKLKSEDIKFSKDQEGIILTLAEENGITVGNINKFSEMINSDDDLIKFLWDKRTDSDFYKYLKLETKLNEEANKESFKARLELLLTSEAVSLKEKTELKQLFNYDAQNGSKDFFNKDGLTFNIARIYKEYYKDRYVRKLKYDIVDRVFTFQPALNLTIEYPLLQMFGSNKVGVLAGLGIAGLSTGGIYFFGDKNYIRKEFSYASCLRQKNCLSASILDFTGNPIFDVKTGFLKSIILQTDDGNNYKLDEYQVTTDQRCSDIVPKEYLASGSVSGLVKIEETGERVPLVDKDGNFCNISDNELLSLITNI